MQHFYLLTPVVLIDNHVCFMGLDSKSDAFMRFSPLPILSLACCEAPGGANQAVSGRHVVLNTVCCPLGVVLEIGRGIFDGQEPLGGERQSGAGPGIQGKGARDLAGAQNSSCGQKIVPRPTHHSCK